jgi:hypothetical protein
MKRSMDAYTSVTHVYGPTVWRGNSRWQHPWLVRNALCPDNRRRTVYLGQDADTYFSWPGRTKINGKWVKGFVTVEGNDTLFIADKEQ